LIVCNLPVVVAASVDLTEHPRGDDPKNTSFLTSYMRFTGFTSTKRMGTNTTAVSLNSLGQASTLPKQDMLSFSADYAETPGTGKSEFSAVEA
jgi:hypothetical protein